MNYTVEWTNYAAADLWELWPLPHIRSAVTVATRQIEELLQSNPFHERYEVVDDRGIMIRAPRGVDFQIDVVNRRVIVTAAWPASDVE